MAKHTVIVKRPHEAPEVVEFEGQYRGDVKALIDKGDQYLTLDYVRLTVSGNNYFVMACDQDAPFKQLSDNFNMITQSGPYQFFSSIKGTVVFLCYQVDSDACEVWDYELADLSQNEIDTALHILSEEYQLELEQQRKDNPYLRTEQQIFHTFKPVQLIQLAYILAGIGRPGIGMTFGTTPYNLEEYEISIQHGRRGSENIVCKNLSIAREIKFPNPSLTLPNMDQRAKNICELKNALMASFDIPDTLFMKPEVADIIIVENNEYEKVCLLTRESYLAYLNIMYAFDDKTYHEISRILKVAVSLYSPEKKESTLKKNWEAYCLPAQSPK